MNEIKEIFIIDDCEFKRGSIKGYMEDIFPDANIHEGECIRDGMYMICRANREEILENPEKYLVILDMMMPFYKDERVEADGGIQVIMEMHRIGMKCPVIIASSESVADGNIQYENYLGSVKESSSVYCQPYYEELLMKI